jgi:hypothetical protein
MALFNTFAQDEYFRRRIREEDARIEAERRDEVRRLMERGNAKEYRKLTPAERVRFRAGLVLAGCFAFGAVVSFALFALIPALVLSCLCGFAFVITGNIPKEK